MSDNMKIWDALRRPPTTALKAIQAGRLKGKTDINPQWRMQAMTEQFGPVGTGWKYTIDKLWTEPGTAGEVCAFALVSVFTRNGEEWSAPTPGIGGSALIAKESSGLHTSDEAFKMAVTDALSVAFKAYGMAADIYLGNFDGSKYKNDPPPPPQKYKDPTPELTELEMKDTLLLIDYAATVETIAKHLADVKGKVSPAQSKTLSDAATKRKAAILAKPIQDTFEGAEVV